MPTSALTHQAETALIGAALFDRRLLDDVQNLTYLDFATREHQEVFKTIVDLRIQRPDATGVRLAELVADRVTLPGIDATYLHGLALNCPDPQAVAVYGRMVLEAALDRELAAHAARMAVEAGDERGVDPVKDHLAALAEAIQTHTANVETATTAITAASDPSSVRDARAEAEELVLADLIQHPHLIAEVQDWLDPEMFSGGRGMVYETIIAVDEYGEPIDELTLAWELGRRAGMEETMSGRTEADEPAERVAPGTIARLVTTAVETGVAVEIGRDLATEHFRAELAAEKTRVLAQGATTGDGVGPASGASVARQQAATEEAPKLVQPPPTPSLGPDGPQLRH